MSSVNIQFHMLPEELIGFVAEMMSQYSLSAELERWFPKTIHEVPSSTDLVDAVSDFGHLDCIRLLYKPRRSTKYERFVLNIGNIRCQRLAQAQLGAGTDNEDAFAVLKKIASELKRRTVPGIWVVSATGHVGCSKIARISQRATEAARAGKVELVDMMFKLPMFVDPPSQGGGIGV